ncbi:hypothetical protein U9M48_014084, partial [Paspalum notatum var. saurae]
MFWGISILDLELQSKCILCKWLYKLLNEDGSWQELIKKKCLHHKSITKVSKKPRDSQFWLGLMEETHVTVSLNSAPLNISSRTTLVRDNLVSRHELVSKAANISLAKGNDKFVWDLNNGSLFDRFLPMNSKLWKVNIPLKINIFLWYLRNKVILTKDNLAKIKCK